MSSDNVISAYTLETTARLTGLSETQLAYWDRVGFFRPSFGHENRRVRFSRVYSFQDVVSLQILKTLRIDLGVSLQHLKEVKEELADFGERKWSDTILYVIKKKVNFFDKDEGKIREAVGGQYAVEIPLEVVRANMREAVAQLQKRDTEQIGEFEKKRYLVHNKQVLAGTRIPVKAIVAYIEDGFSDAEILSEYPSLSAGDIAAVREHSEKAA